MTTPNAGETETVASFSDSDPISHGAGAYSATIDWGDGNQSAGTIVDNGDGSYSVQGTHSYSAAGSYSVSTAVYDNSESGSSAQAFAGSTGTVVQIQSITVQDGSGYESPVTSSGGSAGPAYYILNDDGSGSVTLTASVLPESAMSYTEYIVTDSGGSPIGSGQLSASGLSIALPATADPDDEAFTVTAGTLINGVFSGTQSIVVKAANKLVANPTSLTIAQNAAASISVTGQDDAGNEVPTGSASYVVKDANGNIVNTNFIKTYQNGKTTIHADHLGLAKGSYTIVFSKTGYKDATVNLTIN